MSMQKAELEADAKAVRLLTKKDACGEKITDDEVAAVLRTLFSGKPGPLQQRFSANPIGKRGVVGGTIGATAPLGKSKPALG